MNILIDGDTLIHTKQGLKKISDCGDKIELFDGKIWKEYNINYVQTSPAIRLTMNDGSAITISEESNIYVNYLTYRTKFVFAKPQINSYLERWAFKSIQDKTEYTTPESCTQTHPYLLGYYMGVGKERNGVFYIPANKNNETSYIINPIIFENLLPTEVFKYNSIELLEFLAGWIDSNGSIRGKGTRSESFAICSVREQALRNLQFLLRNAGINNSKMWIMSHKTDPELLKLRHVRRKTDKRIVYRINDIWALHIPSFECVPIPTKIKIIEHFGPRVVPNNADRKKEAKHDSAIRQKIVSITPVNNCCLYQVDRTAPVVLGNVLI